MRLPPARRRSAISASISRFGCPTGTTTSATTEATVTALGLIAAQAVEILVHSNLDDGFAGLFADMSATLGMVLIEKYIVEELIGARVPAIASAIILPAARLRLAFHRRSPELTTDRAR